MSEPRCPLCDEATVCGHEFHKLFTEADLAAAKVKENEAANEMLRMVVGSLKGYPNHGGDIGVMTEVDRIVAAARSEMLVLAADILTKEIEARGHLDMHMVPINELRDAILALDTTHLSEIRELEIRIAQSSEILEIVSADVHYMGIRDYLRRYINDLKFKLENVQGTK